ncbi:MAG: hypothetical protein EOS11_29520 [Mesorhizobium sp.]|uniref:hypothetical protein n=1 Tax=Mesorhizobium sp. TaxID=1871066 RepID=UPI000FE34DD7|nr:hypothetical protein [Mesorhizobium sp.]RWO37133.1 MAG: hypothetical protein EOS11_29520 [Mesorhizobium sp.]TIN75508.1 MAG: hypothetical protein E5Y09_27750 [Mesorhizobium sp.]
MPDEFQLAAMAAKKLFELVGGKAAAKIMAELFPEKPPAWLPEVYENVGKIVNKAILTNEVVKLQGDFWGIKEQAVLLDAEAGGTDYRHTLQESVQGPYYVASAT